MARRRTRQPMARGFYLLGKQHVLRGGTFFNLPLPVKLDQMYAEEKYAYSEGFWDARRPHIVAYRAMEALAGRRDCELGVDDDS